MNARPSRLALALALSAVAAGSAATEFPNEAANARVSHGMVLSLPDLSPVANAASVMQRNRHGVSFSFRTTGLEPDTVYTMWVLVFNNPQFCIGTADLGCSPMVGDFAADTPIAASLVWGAGGISDGWGQIRLESTVFEGEGGWPGFKAFGPGLLDSSKAEIHLVLRRHGSAAELETAGLLETALTTPGGCVGAPCGAAGDVQAAAHLP